MQIFCSKQVTALYPGGQLLQDEYFRTIRERIFNKDRYTRNEESGIEPRKKTVIDSLGLGSNDRGHNPGAGMGLGRDENESKNRTVGSGYNDGESADDETGPGHTSQPVDPYYTSDVFNELYMDLKLKGQGHNDSVRRHLKKILQGNPAPIQHRRYPVDGLKKEYD